MSSDASRMRKLSLYCMLGITSCALILIALLSNTAASDGPETEASVFQAEAQKVLARNKLVVASIDCGPSAAAYSCSYQANGLSYGPYEISEETAYLLEDSPLREHTFKLSLDGQGALSYNADNLLEASYSLETVKVEARVVLSETALKWAKDLKK